PEVVRNGVAVNREPARSAAAPGGPALPRLPDLFAEAYRLRLLRGLEEMLGQLGFCRIAGVDEAGRGCLAGPVVAAAVIVDTQSLALFRGQALAVVDDGHERL